MVENKWRRSCALILGILFCANLSVVAANAQTPSLEQKKPLQAEIKHDESLPPMSGELQIGQQLDDSQLQSLNPDNVWFPVPSWFAGTWQSTTKSVDYVQDCRSGASTSPHRISKEASEVVHGHQKDKTGQIWEYLEIPRLQKVELQDAVCYLRALREDVINSDADEVNIKFLTNQITVANKNHQITETNQVQQIGRFAPLDDGMVELRASLKNFDGDGDPIQLQRSVLIMRRAKPYEEVDNLHGHDLKKLFVEYLQKIGRQDLLPPVAGRSL